MFALDTLNEKLREMSHGVYQWMAVPPGQQHRSCALIGYSNPDNKTLPNHLCYLFPAVALAGHSEKEPSLIVQLSPGSMPALSRGLYWDEGSLKLDPMEDFFRVWIPLKRCLGLLDNEGCVDDQSLDHESGSNQDVRMGDAEECSEALKTHLTWLSQCTEIFRK